VQVTAVLTTLEQLRTAATTSATAVPPRTLRHWLPPSPQPQQCRRSQPLA